MIRIASFRKAKGWTEMGTERSTQQQILLKRASRVRSPAAMTLISANLVIFIMAIWALAGFGSIRGAIEYYLRGETLFVDSTRKSFGIVSPGDHVDLTFKLTNRGREPLRVLGCSAICGCMTPRDLPFVLRPSAGRDFKVSIDIPELERVQSRFLDLELVLYTDLDTQSRIPLHIKGEIRGESDPSQ